MLSGTLHNYDLIKRFYLHCTSRVAVSSITTPNPLLIKHQYFPESFLEAVKVRLFAVLTVTPFLIHVIWGTGFPVAAHLNVTVSNSFTVWSLGLMVKLGWTVSKQRKSVHTLWTAYNPSRYQGKSGERSILIPLRLLVFPNTLKLVKKKTDGPRFFNPLLGDWKSEKTILLVYSYATHGKLSLQL